MPLIEIQYCRSLFTPFVHCDTYLEFTPVFFEMSLILIPAFRILITNGFSFEAPVVYLLPTKSLTSTEMSR